MLNEKQFPILGTRESIPWIIVEPHEKQAQNNHGGQTLKRLAERGGLCWVEMFAVLTDSKWKQMDELEAKNKVIEIVNNFKAVTQC